MFILSWMIKARMVFRCTIQPHTHTHTHTSFSHPVACVWMKELESWSQITSPLHQKIVDKSGHVTHSHTYRHTSHLTRSVTVSKYEAHLRRNNKSGVPPSYQKTVSPNFLNFVLLWSPLSTIESVSMTMPRSKWSSPKALYNLERIKRSCSILCSLDISFSTSSNSSRSS